METVTGDVLTWSGWPDLREWLLTVSTLGLAGLTFLYGRREHEERVRAQQALQDEQNKQKRRLRQSIETAIAQIRVEFPPVPDALGGLGLDLAMVTVDNSSDQLFRNVQVLVGVLDDQQKFDVRTVAGPAASLAPGQEASLRLPNPPRPQDIVGSSDLELKPVATSETRARFQLTLSDVDGERWMRDEHGYVQPR